MGMVTCGGCGLKFDRLAQEAEYLSSRWYHQGCAAVKHEKMNLDKYICKIFGLKSPGPQNNILIKKYKKELGYTFIGMQNTLKYFYEIKKHTTNKSEERVGIIPYIYLEAQDYFKKIEDTTKRIADHAIDEKPLEIQVGKISCHKINLQKTNVDELAELFNEE